MVAPFIGAAPLSYPQHLLAHEHVGRRLSEIGGVSIGQLVRSAFGTAMSLVDSRRQLDQARLGNLRRAWAYGHRDPEIHTEIEEIQERYAPAAERTDAGLEEAIRVLESDAERLLAALVERNRGCPEGLRADLAGVRSSLPRVYIGKLRRFDEALRTLLQMSDA